MGVVPGRCVTFPGAPTDTRSFPHEAPRYAWMFGDHLNEIDGVDRVRRVILQFFHSGCGAGSWLRAADLTGGRSVETIPQRLRLIPGGCKTLVAAAVLNLNTPVVLGPRGEWSGGRAASSSRIGSPG